MKFKHLRDCRTGEPIEIPDVPPNGGRSFFEGMNPALRTPGGAARLGREAAARLLRAFGKDAPPLPDHDGAWAARQKLSS